MANKHSQSEVQVLENYRVSLQNSIEQPVLAAELAEYGYDSAKIEEGKTLHATCRAAFDGNKKESGEATEAHDIFATKFDALLETYTTHRKKAKVLFRNEPNVLGKLGLANAMPEAYIKKVETMKTFYNGLAADQQLMVRATTFKIIAADVNACLSALTELEASRNAYLRETGESQEATRLKDAAFKLLDDWMQEFYAVARIALSDHPQLLEALGLTIRS